MPDTIASSSGFQRVPRGIPKNILQFWHDKSAIPPEMQEAMDGTRRHNSDYRAALLDDGEIAALLGAGGRAELLALFQLVRIPASRSDIARLVMLEEFGGFYLDASMQFHTSLNPFLARDPELVLVRRDDFPRYRDCPENAHVMGGIIGAPPRSPFISRCIRLLVANLLSGEFNTRSWEVGPGVINRTLQAYDTGGRVEKLSFKEMLKESVSYRRSPGVSNAWVKQQEEGIIDPAHYASGPLDVSYGSPAPSRSTASCVIATWQPRQRTTRI